MESTELLGSIRTIVGGFAYVDGLSDDDPLHLDSLAIAELLEAVENKFGVAVAAGFIEPDVASLHSIALAVQRLCGGAA